MDLILTHDYFSVRYGKVLHALNVEHALVVHCCGLDELAPLGTAQAVEVTREGGVTPKTIDLLAMPGVKKVTIEDLKGGDCKSNAATLRAIFGGGEAAASPNGETIAMNAGAGLYVYGLADSIEEGLEKARKVRYARNAGVLSDTLLFCDSPPRSRLLNSLIHLHSLFTI